MRDDAERLQDILEAIAQIEKYAARGPEAFERDELIQVWMVHHLQIIGEAVRSLSETLRQSHPEVPWAQIGAMRNILVHEYFDVDLEEVWVTVERDLPGLKDTVQHILGQLASDPENDVGNQEGERCRAVTLLIRIKTVQREPFFAIQANDAMTCPLDIIQERG